MAVTFGVGEGIHLKFRNTTSARTVHSNPTSERHPDPSPTPTLTQLVCTTIF
ncbi:hypothetical protein [uncultured Hymenobacter sp.]|uniref:hypothetical protein n=1 Tax=uncultured Hymenobacter sp. TaxID=170016 RepID=UPI0035C980CC